MNKTNSNIVTKEDDFWNWFKTNNSKYYYINQILDEEKREELLNVFLKQLHNYCDKLFFEIGGIANEIQELIISTGGDKNYFHKVEELVSRAPQIDEWQIIAFKPPMGVDFVTDYEGIKLDPHEIWFLPLDNESAPKELGLKVCIPNYNPKREEDFLNGCYQMLDTILGEKSVMMDLHHVEIDKLPKKPEKRGLIKLSELPEYISWRKTKV